MQTLAQAPALMRALTQIPIAPAIVIQFDSTFWVRLGIALLVAALIFVGLWFLVENPVLLTILAVLLLIAAVAAPPLVRGLNISTDDGDNPPDPPVTELVDCLSEIGLDLYAFVEEAATELNISRDDLRELTRNQCDQFVAALKAKKDAGSSAPPDEDDEEEEVPPASVTDDNAITEGGSASEIARGCVQELRSIKYGCTIPQGWAAIVRGVILPFPTEDQTGHAFVCYTTSAKADIKTGTLTLTINGEKVSVKVEAWAAPVQWENLVPDAQGEVNKIKTGSLGGGTWDVDGPFECK